MNIEDGVNVIRRFAKDLPETPGVYRMLNENEDVLYVGKARILKRRVLSYTQVGKLPNRLQRMVAETKSMEFVHTHTEVEALLLESNLIKKLKPRYNVLLRDDKSFPYIYITTDKDFPQISKHRGKKSKQGRYFGPFASVRSVNRTIQALQRAFMIRNCTDSYFAARKRPCLQYHIKRCTAPCVGYVDRADYDGQIKGAVDFLSGKGGAVKEDLAQQMQKASDKLDFESAARLRDRIRALAAIQTSQDINLSHIQDADIIGLSQETNSAGRVMSCVEIFFFRGGQNYGNKAFFPSHAPEEPPETILSAFVAQFYENKPIPPVVLTSHIPDEIELLALALEESAGNKVDIRKPVRGEGRRAMEFVLRNAGDALKRHLNEKMGQDALLAKLVDIFDLDRPPKRIEVYDNSHISGEQMVGGMIVATPDGFDKNSYRKFNIRQAAKSDDYGMMKEVLTRRFSRAIKEAAQSTGETSDYAADKNWPDLILIDGGKGQLSVTMEVLRELDIVGKLNVAAISKGPDRNAGREIIHMPGRSPLMLAHDDPVLYYLQRIRDEAHRFAIGSHRQRRAKNMTKSPLDDIPGIGAKRKKALLLYFGSAKEVSNAAIADLAKVEGISKSAAQKIYDFFHET